MFDAPTTSRSALDQTLDCESVGECSERLIALESFDGQCMGRGTGGPADGTQGIPLGKRPISIRAMWQGGTEYAATIFVLLE
jgi:hypothetical protein